MNEATPLIKTFDGISPVIDSSVFVAPNAVIIGDVEIGAESSVWYNCVIRGDDYPVRIGRGTNIQDGTIIHVTYKTNPTRIGDQVIIGHAAKLHGCDIGDGALVGIGAIVLDGCVLEPGSMLAAGALLTPNKRVPSGELWGGSPARKLRDLNEADKDFLRWDAEHYIKLAKQYRSAAETT